MRNAISVTDNRCITTYTGVIYNPFDPKPEDVRIQDIAHHLSLICRFTGAVAQMYSVAQHSWLVSYNCDKDWALYGLLHDAAEAYINDIASPLKHSPEFAAYRDLEKRNQIAILDTFGLSYEKHPSIKDADERMFHTERRDLMPNAEMLCEDAEPYEWHIVPVSSSTAERLFLARFMELNKSRVTV